MTRFLSDSSGLRSAEFPDHWEMHENFLNAEKKKIAKYSTEH